MQSLVAACFRDSFQFTYELLSHIRERYLSLASHLTGKPLCLVLFDKVAINGSLIITVM